ncbi:hypothetical protein B0T17DRAFT_503652 [Bombardia bombarda]|uniref:Uncharacterized protein n=1 Tax=Bombardia bombarda TaxID=252184 RepID=A0AA40CEU4_9PEZI|nr:hypothetical protein B0T17DRAFT_503652 [Bombardia bombarda]
MPRQPNVLHKDPDRDRDRDRDRKPSFSHKASFSLSLSSPSKGKRRADAVDPSSSSGPAVNGGAFASSSASASGQQQLIADHPSHSRSYSHSHSHSHSSSRSYYTSSASLGVPPLPDHGHFNAPLHSPASADYSFSSMLSRNTPTPVNGYSAVSAGGQLAPPAAVATGQPSEQSVVHQHIQDTANKRIATLEYLRKVHEGHVYWLNTLLFEKPDLARMPYFDSRKLARRATNFFLLGLSLPTVVDLNSNTPADFLRSLNALLSEFDSFQQLHSEHGGASSSSLSRARIPQMFRRATAPSSKARRSSNATTVINSSSSGTTTNGGAGNDIGYPLEPVDSGGTSAAVPAGDGVGGGGGGTVPSSTSVISFAASETDLLPGEEYTHLLTPSLPFDPDFFETFATLCDTLVDTYARLLTLLPTPRECTGVVAELFGKADGKLRKIIVQGVVKEFEDASRGGAKTEVANIGKVVLGGLM